ncbi:MAG: FAD-linked oxidase C-terminal domain-containing protein [Balneolaceae bacterium]
MPDIHIDSLTRRLYANDASMYEELPRGVSYPGSLEDIRDLVLASIDQGFSITARGGGTSLAGQATGNGVVMDVSRHMTRIQEIDPVRQIAWVQPGVIRDSLNRKALDEGLQFGPDTSTTNRCMIGGMIGNNSCGSFSIKYRTTREHTLEIEAVLSDGSVAVFRPLTDVELEEKCRKEDLEGKIYRGMIKLLQENKEEIRESYPHPEIIRRNTGYALDRLCEMSPITSGGRPFNLAELLCGSEGTLAMTASAKLNLVPLPEHKILVIPQFGNLRDALKAAVTAVGFQPSAVELVDDIILNATKGNLEQKKNRFFLEGDPKSLLIIQLEGDDLSKLNTKAEKLVGHLQKESLGYSHPVVTEDDKMQRVWELRKAGLGLLMGLGADSRSPTFVEDTAVRVQDLPAYVDDFQKILDKYNTKCVFYAHASVGELHLRPVIDISNPEGLQKMKRMADEVAGLVKRYRGSLSGEHGDGRARSPFIEKVLGSNMIPLLRQVKELWDPDYRFNPGKILDPKPMDSDLRFLPGYKTADVETAFHWRKENGFGHALEQCNGAGVCRKRAESGGTMCPSYHATLEEKDTTRGRANLFRQIFISRQQEAFTSEEIREGLELCLSCKACKSECPANVDMARMKAEFLHGWHQNHGLSLADRFFGEPEKLYGWASAFAPITNYFARNRFIRHLLQEMMGMDARRTLPAFAGQTFKKWFKKNRSHYQRNRKNKVVLLVDIFTDYHDPHIARAACKVFDRLGYDVIVPALQATGRPQISRGLLGRAKEICHRNLEHLYPFVNTGIPIVGLEPSEILTLRDEYLDLCEDDKLHQAKRVSENTFQFEEFIVQILGEAPEFSDYFNSSGQHVLVHGHCHAKALVGNDPIMDMLEKCGFQPRDLKTGCCGMAGSFGYQKEKYEVSMEIGELILFPALRKEPENGLICAPGFSCRHQISDGTGREALHPAEILENILA